MLKEEIERYLNYCKKSKGLSDLSLKAYRIDFNQFENFMEGLNPLSKESIIQYNEYLHISFKPKTAKRKIACIKAFYRYMEIEDIINYNPFHKVVLKYKEPITLPKTIPLENINLVLSHAYAEYNNATTKHQKGVRLQSILIIEILFSTGMRVSEVSNLKWENIDLSTGTVRILGKGSKERITCITNNAIISLIKEHKKSNSSDYVFVNRLGNKYSDQSIRNMINNYAEKANINQHITPHMFRHTFATELHNADVDIQYIQQLLGHSSITTTQIYSHISNNQIRNIIETRHPRNKMTFY